MTDDQPILSVVIGTYNRRAQVERAVNSVIRGTRSPFVLYVTDAGSTDGTVEYLSEIDDPRVIPMLVGRKLGQARAYNDVFYAINTPFVCWLSDDNEVLDGMLDLAVRILQDEPRIGMVGLKVRDKAGPFVDAPYVGGISKFGILNVNQGVLRTPFLCELGGFSEKFRDYGIDPDLTARVLLAGFDVVYTRDVAVHHYRNWEADPSLPEHARMQERQRVYLKLYHEVYRETLGQPISLILKRALWKAIRASLKLDVNCEKTFLGFNARDWQNIFATRSVSIMNELIRRDQPYHLRQRRLR